MRHRRAAVGAFIAALTLGARAGAVEDPGFATLDAVGEGTRIGFAASLGLRRVFSDERQFTTRFDLFGHAPLSDDFSLHGRLAAAYGPGAAFAFASRRDPGGSVGFELEERLAIYAVEVGGAWRARFEPVTLPLALTLALPLFEPDPQEASVLRGALSARLAARPTTWSNPALRLSTSPTLDYSIVRLRADAGLDVQLDDPDARGYEVGGHLGLAASVQAGSMAFMVEGVWYGTVGDFEPFLGRTFAVGARWIGASLRPSLHLVLPAGADLADDDVMWWVVALDWVPADAVPVTP